MPSDGNATVSDAVHVWSTRVLAGRRLAPRTRERYERHCTVISNEFGSRRLARLTADDIEAMLDRQVADGARSRDTLAKLRSTIVQILEFAVRRGPGREELGRARNGAGAGGQGSSSHVADARRGAHPLRCCENEHLGPMIRLGLLVGMRPGELAGLEWGDIEFERRIVTVGHAIQMRGSHRLHVDVLKRRRKWDGRPSSRSDCRTNVDRDT